MNEVLKTGKELRDFLEQVIEQSVKSAKTVVAEEEKKRQLELYRKMQEQEEAEEEESEESDKDADSKASDEDSEKDPMQRPAAADRAPEKPATPDEVDLKNILYSINQIRDASN